MKTSIMIIMVLTFMSCQSKYDMPVTIKLHENWTFKSISDSIWQSASVPGNVHSDLLHHNIIKQPFIGSNEDSLQWISETDWVYKTQFPVDQKTLQKKNIELVFQGLDTYAFVYLNDSLILKTENAFREYSVNVKTSLKAQNELRIRFQASSISEDKQKAALPYQLPEGNRIFTRKAQFQYGWDWGPKLITSGIWRPIILEAWNEFKIKNMHVKVLNLNNKKAQLHIDVEVDSNSDKKLTYNVYINDSLHKSITAFPQTIEGALRPLDNITINNPKLWWPHNLGDPYLYDIKVVVEDDNVKLDSISIKKGLRTIALITEKDSIGESFYFNINDKPVFMKGANYIPQNSMQNQVSDRHYAKLLDDVVGANMNMLRVWGGGIYENDIFYDLCDEKGILVWQDFMFACAMYPGDENFIENVKDEAIQNVKRLRNHASIALWCGNNENSEGWHRWGWQTDKSNEEKDEIWNDYLKLFDSILPNIVSELTHTDYWESSPRYGRGNPKYKTEGDAHDWWVWHDGYPFEHLEENVPRFMSEFGFQSYPSYELVRYINEKDSIDITSEGFLNHQKHSRGFQIINTYMKRDFPVPEPPEDYIYVSQLLQAYGITKGIEAHRRAKPYTMGSLYWQLNDCWPAVSWSSIDFFGNWKALHYHTKKAFKNVLISNDIKDDILDTYIINDYSDSFNGMLTIKFLDFNGNVILEQSEGFDIQPNSSDIKHTLDLSTLNINRNNTVIISEFGDNTTYSYLVKPKDLQLKKAPIVQSITKTTKGFQVSLKSSTLQKNVFLYTKEKGHFSDNYFDLMPNESIVVDFETEANNLTDLKIKTLNDLL